MDASIRRIPLFIVLLAGTSLGHAEPRVAPDGPADFATLRIETAFQVAAEMPPVPAVEVPDGGQGRPCARLHRPVPARRFRPNASTPPTRSNFDPPLIVETRRGSTSILTRLFDFTVAARLSEQHPE